MSRAFVLTPLLFAAAALPAQPARAPVIAALRAIEPGQWQLRPLGGEGPGRSMCVFDPAVLIQLRHPGATCTRFVVENEAQTATIHYTCPGDGYGRTTIDVETSRLFQLDSQGIAGNAPFAVSYEGRRLGACTR